MPFLSTQPTYIRLLGQVYDFFDLQMLYYYFCSTVRVWKNENENDSEVIEAHKPAVLALEGMFDYDGTDRIFTGLYNYEYIKQLITQIWQ